jgi:hypothetical protein
VVPLRLALIRPLRASCVAALVCVCSVGCGATTLQRGHAAQLSRSGLHSAVVGLQWRTRHVAVRQPKTPLRHSKSDLPVPRAVPQLLRLVAVERVPTAAYAHVEQVELHAIVTEVGTPTAFTLFAVSTRRETVLPTSAASVVESDGSAVFASPEAADLWRLSGSHKLPMTDPKPYRWHLTRGQFSFIEQGTAFTYRDAITAPRSAGSLRADVLAHLGGSGATVPPTNLLAAYGFLLATAPLTQPAREAVVRAVLQIPGIRTCGTVRDLLGRSGETVCVSDAAMQVRVVVRPAEGAVIAVDQLLRTATPAYPGVPAGSTIQADAFRTH